MIVLQNRHLLWNCFLAQFSIKRSFSAWLISACHYSSFESGESLCIYGFSTYKGCLDSYTQPPQAAATVLLFSLITTILAASLEVWLISYAGQLIDLISDTSPQAIWAIHGGDLLLVGLVILLLRPLLQFARHAANDIGLDCNIANLTRWRAFGHLSQQSVGWFQEDLTGRTSVRLVDIGNHTASIIYQCLNAIAFGLVYMIGIVTLMAGTDLRLALPLFGWLQSGEFLGTTGFS